MTRIAEDAADDGGTLRRRWCSADLVLTERTYARHVVSAPLRHDGPVVVQLVAGATLERCDGATTARAAGDLFVIPAGVEHARTATAPATCFGIAYGPEWTRRMGAAAADGVSASRTPDHRARWIAAELLRELRHGEAARGAVLEGLALALLDDIASGVRDEAPRDAQRWLQQARDYLAARCCEPLRMRDLAAEVGVHPVHLSRAFRARFGVSTTEYVRQCRIAVARRALAEGNRAISAIALDTGFADQCHFARVFKRMTGHTPLAFRASHRG